MALAQPIIREIIDSQQGLFEFENITLSNESDKTQDIIKNFPTVYIHNWTDTGMYEVYVGESNDVIRRTKEHYNDSSSPDNWQHNLKTHDAKLFIIGHEHFNKSMTLDIENRLMHYLMSVDKVKHVHNLRDNPQTRYYPVDELDEIFSNIWNGLRKKNKDLFPTESAIRDSAIYKASPLHKLTNEQIAIRDLILSKVKRAFDNDERHQLIFIEGEAGTGKTVLNSSTFYELYCRAEESGKTIKCHLLVNHDEQLRVYEQIANKLGLTKKYGNVVNKPTPFITNYSEDDPVDVVFVDEAHLLLTQGQQAYRGKNQLDDIIKRARVTVIMFDENQILSTTQIWEKQILNEYRSMAVNSGNYCVLENQLRMHADPDTVDWIDSFTKKRYLKKIPQNVDYQIRIFDTPQELDDAIREKANSKESSLSRLVATYDWEYSTSRTPENVLKKYWEVVIGDWHKPWNRELSDELTYKEKRENKKLSWAEQPQTINEIGSTFTIQGFDLNYVGVILGPSVIYKDGMISFDPDSSHNSKATRNRTLSDGTKCKFSEELLRHELRVLMTRGVNGMFIYAANQELRNALKEAAK